jgi:hypothetical protein|tara:strand:- start:306 stop:416 length:111 start_codon:yes stop_codon:yes gene_type:complete
MKNKIILFVLAAFLLGACASSKRGCDGKKKFNTGMW